MSVKGRRDNAGKPATHLLPAAALMEIAKVFEFGAQKYSPNNYRNGLPWSTYVGSGLRHLWLWYAGEEADPESGLSYLAHLGCNVLMLMDAVIYKHGDDDRWEARRRKMLTFGGALEALKDGKKVTRSGWDGKGMWLHLQRPDEHSKMQLPYIYMKTAQGYLVPWLASQTDMLVEDWTILVEEKSDAG